jgi:CubicO group peptidase (beta-lactamase class C family)
MRAADIVASGLVERGVAPLAAAGCATPKQDVGLSLEIGGATTSFFDLASVTKSMTAVAVARSGLPRDAELASLVPELAGTDSARVTLELLLSHRAGLVAHLPLYEPLTRGLPVDGDVALGLTANARRDDAKGKAPKEGFAALYSDLGYILAGAALARHAGVADAAAAVARYVTRARSRQRPRA